MKFEIEAFLPSQKELLKEFGLEDNGRVQKVVDASFMHYMKLKMPQSSEQHMTHSVISNIGTGEIIGFMSSFRTHFFTQSLIISI